MEVPLLGETLLVDPLLTQVLTILDRSGIRVLPLAIPTDLPLHGAAVFHQARAMHLLPSEADGLEPSNALRLTAES